MSVLTVRSVKSAFWNVLMTDTAGAAVRAALGASSTSILTRRGVAGTLPVAPFIVIQYGPVSGKAGFTRSFFPTWWLYDDATRDWNRLNDLAALIEAAYPDDALAYCYTNYAGGIGDEVTDATLGGRPAIAMRYQVSGRF